MSEHADIKYLKGDEITPVLMKGNLIIQFACSH